MYTREHYEQDKAIAIYMFNKHFKGHYLKDDLIQVAILELWKLRQRKNYKDYVRCACSVAKNNMVDYLRIESRSYAESLFDKVGGSDLRLIDVLEMNQPSPQELYEFRELVKKIIPLPIQLSTRDRKIISMHLKHYTQTEIARTVGISQQYVSIVIKKFRESARQVLGE